MRLLFVICLFVVIRVLLLVTDLGEFDGSGLPSLVEFGGGTGG